ncbi:LptF/LptG family permease, partial [Sulfitobacter sp. HI0023]|uniref:LptF/LptG family permease n=2 Tax=Sulfitobacter TaxID=60136 RepID=UPI000A543D7F
GGPVRRIEAESAQLFPGAWLLKNVKSWPLISGINAEGNAKTSEELTLPSSLTLDRIRQTIGTPGAVSIYDLPEFIRQLEQAGFSTRRHQVWMQAELARPFFLAAMVLV